jgi:excisionase family DNA binding protein
MRKREPKMLTVREAAEKLGAAESSVRLWVRTGRFPGAKLEETPVGSYWLIPDTDLEGFSMGKAGRPPKAEGASKRGRKGQ